LRIDEVSAVTRGAGKGTRIMLMKRDDAPLRADVAEIETEIDDGEDPEQERGGSSPRRSIGRSFR
jgi:hypothetical protein